ncbi:MAG: acetylornithine/succinylornithine family transaminase [Tahibacter sp.]
MNVSTTPSSASAALLEKCDRYYVPVYRPRALVLDRGVGSRVWDTDGREYVDFTAGIAVSALGHADPELITALTDQASKLWHTSNVFVSAPPLLLAEELVDASGFAERVFLCNSGAEANEAAIKLVRRWAAAQGRPADRRTILSFQGSFHGRTLATVTATAQPKYQEGYEPLPGGFRYAAYNDIDSVREAMAQGDVAAVLIEPIQGEGGVTPARKGFLTELRALCDLHGALLVLDEIQAGMGRTGMLWAHQWEGVRPDIVTVAKALGAGFPIGAMLAGPAVAEVMQYGSHGSTFGGNPLAAAVARVALRRIRSHEVLANVARQSDRLIAGLQRIGTSLSIFADVRGRGLLLGAQLADAYRGRAGEVLDAAARNGLLLLQAGPDVLRLVPPLTISDGEVTNGLQRLEQALREFVTVASG